MGGRTKDVMQVLFHQHVWLYTEYIPILYWWTGANSVSPYVMIVTWWTTSGIILYHRSIAYELSIYCPSLIYFSVAIAIITTKYQKHYFCYRYILLPLPLLSYYFATKHFAADIKFPGAVELTTQPLILENILWLPLCRINKFGSYTCGLSTTRKSLVPTQIRTSQPMR